MNRTNKLPVDFTSQDLGEILARIYNGTSTQIPDKRMDSIVSLGEADMLPIEKIAAETIALCQEAGYTVVRQVTAKGGFDTIDVFMNHPEGSVMTLTVTILGGDIRVRATVLVTSKKNHAE